MPGFDSFSMKDMAKLKNANEADDLLNKMSNPEGQDPKNEYQSLKEVMELKRLVEKQTYLLHAFWLLLKEKGATNEELDKALNEAVLLEKRKDFKNKTVCPTCGKGLQAMENKPFTSKCFYCGNETLDNPYKKFDDLDPYNPSYVEPAQEISEPVTEEDAEQQEIQEAQDVISQSFEPYDVSKDLNFDDENV